MILMVPEVLKSQESLHGDNYEAFVGQFLGAPNHQQEYTDASSLFLENVSYFHSHFTV